jgi:hypothetical protein
VLRKRLCVRRQSPTNVHRNIVPDEHKVSFRRLNTLSINGALGRLMFGDSKSGPKAKPAAVITPLKAKPRPRSRQQRRRFHGPPKCGRWSGSV